MKLMQRCKDFRNLLKNDCIMMPGAFNGMVGRIAADQGYKALYISGAAITASSGVPDIGLRTLDQFCKVIKQVSSASNLPLLVDADTGFGEGQMCARTVWQYFHSGACGLHIQDQVFPKRCGHLDGKQLIKKQQMVKKIQIAANTSKQVSQGQFIVCARTDAYGVLGLQQCINRSKAYIDAGADMIFPQGLSTKQQFQKVSKQLKGYGSRGGPFLLANMTQFGKTDYIHINDFKNLGYNCVIYPVTTFRVAMKAVQLVLSNLKQKGTQKQMLDKMQSRKQLYSTIHYTPGKQWYFPQSSKK